DAEGRPRGVVFLAPSGLEETPNASRHDAFLASTEGDVDGSLVGHPVELESHCTAVADRACDFAKASGLPEELQADLRLAGLLHDIGKPDVRCQAWLHYGDPLGPDPDEPGSILAKSGRKLPLIARRLSALPERWRHEALSVR